ncbi:MAG: ATP-binding protein [Bryobacteraceae bacterium]|jgi:signal transduction histidine kinase
MNLQAKLTLGAVLLETLIVGIISAVDLGNSMQIEFDGAHKSAGMVRLFAGDYVAQTLNRMRDKPLREALRDPALSLGLKNVMADSDELIEIAVVDTHNEILADSDPSRLGVFEPPYPDFETWAAGQTWLEKVNLLASSKYSLYQMEKALGTTSGETVVTVRVVVDAALIRKHVWPTLTRSAQVALLLFAGAVGLTFLASALAFRRLGELGHMLDQVASGEYAPDKDGVEKLDTDAPGNDELAIMASKVSILSERLRGAQFEVSDLRGNIDRLLQDLEDAVFIFDRELRLVFASGSVEKFLGTDRAGFTGKSLTDIFPPNTTLGLMIAQSAQTGRPIRNRRAPVAIAGQAAAALLLLSVDLLEALPGATGSGVLVRLRDPEAQRKLGHELQTADRLAAISRVSSGVAHEVKNPLNAILLHVEVAKAKLTRGDTDVIPQMEIISREILRLDRVVKTFLDFTRPMELNLATVPVQRLVDEIVDLARPQAEALKIRVLVAQAADGVDVRVDGDLLKQAVLNIAVNAMQAMPNGGELRFESSATADVAEIRISDSGPGIPLQLREKIFTLYFTTKKEGSGIGLAMTFRIVQLHDGTIDFTSEPGKGASFSIRLPIAL